MLPRSQSIFHLGEEGGAQCHRGGGVGAAMVVGGGGVGAAMVVGGGGGGRRVRERALVVGLQILVHHHHGAHHGHGRHAHAANIVLKQMVRPQRAAAAGRHAVSCSFLKACSLCRRELSPTKDVYMYRGDKGFCSEECRWQQILVDEAREREAVSKERRGMTHHHSPHRTPIRGRPRKTLAVA